MAYTCPECRLPDPDNGEGDGAQHLQLRTVLNLPRRRPMAMRLPALRLVHRRCWRVRLRRRRRHPHPRQRLGD